MLTLFLAMLYFAFFTAIIIMPLWLPYVYYLNKHQERVINDRFSVIGSFFKFYFRLLTLKRPLLK